MTQLRATSLMATAVAMACLASPGTIPSNRLTSIPIYFEPNHGQFDPQVRFLARGAKYQAWITDSKLVLRLNDKSAPVVIQFGPSSAKPKAEGLDRQLGTSSYFFGNDERKWTTGVPSFSRARLQDVYPGIDVVFYAHNETREIEYDFVVKPGADPSQISIEFDKKMKPKPGPLGEITLQTPTGELRHRIPSVHQGTKHVDFHTTFDGTRQRFHFGDYDLKQELVVDPGVVYSSILGEVGDIAQDVAADSHGNTYIVGTIYYNTNFPLSNFADAPSGSSRFKTFVVKIGSTLSQGVYPRIYSAYFGGSNDAAGSSIAVDSAGAAYVTGTTWGTDFPVRNAFQTARAGLLSDSYILKISATPGTAGHTLVYSSYLGGLGDDRARGVAVDSTGAAYILGDTSDPASFPVINTSSPPSRPINDDAYVVKVAATPSNTGVYERVYSMVFGGSGSETGGGIAVDPAGAAYIGGSTTSTDLPVLAASQTTRRGTAVSYDGYIAKIGATPVSGRYQPAYSTYIGGSGEDNVTDIAVDALGNAYVVGWTESADFPIALALQQTRLASRDAFVAMVNATPAGSPAMYTIPFSSYFGGTGITQGLEIAAGTQGNIYISGVTELRQNGTIPLVNPAFLVTFQNNHAFVTKISVGTTASRLEYSTLIGRSGSYPTGLAVDPAGNAHIVGETSFPVDFPIVASNPGPTTSQNGDLFSFAVKLNNTVQGSTVGIGANYSARKFNVSGIAACAPGDYITPQYFNWAVGTSCTVTFPETETTGDAGYRYDFKSWNDGSTNRMRTITAGSVPQVLTANLDGFARLTTSVTPQLGAPIDAGTVTPSGVTYQPLRSQVTLTATPSQGWYFKGWQAQTSNRVTSLSITVFMDRPQTAVAEFGTYSETRTGLQFVPVTPCRILDTRQTQNDVLAQPQVALRVRDVTPSSTNCGIPAAALAFSLNATVVPKGPLGYITLWPKGSPQPTVSTLNSVDGRIKANAAVVSAGTNGTVSIFATDPTDVVLDINGYFVLPGALSSAYYPVTPCRIIDTRTPNGSPKLAAKGTRTISVQAAGCGIPANARAYALNATVVPTRTLGYLNLWPTGTAQPLSSTLNALTGTVVANSAIVRAGTGGSIDAFATDETELILDITGYFGPPGAPGALAFYPVTPCRLLDTRTGSGIPLPAGNLSSVFTLTGIAGCAVPEWAKSLSLNSTVVPQPTLGYLTLYPLDVPQPLVSTLNALDGAVTSNASFTEIAFGKMVVYASDRTHFILDLSGYFAP